MKQYSVYSSMHNRCAVNIVSFESIGHHINTKEWKERYNLSVIFAQYLISNGEVVASLPDLMSGLLLAVFQLLLRCNDKYKHIVASKRYTQSWKINVKIFQRIFKTPNIIRKVFLWKKCPNFPKTYYKISKHSNGIICFSNCH